MQWTLSWSYALIILLITIVVSTRTKRGEGSNFPSKVLCPAKCHAYPTRHRLYIFCKKGCTVHLLKSISFKRFQFIFLLIRSLLLLRDQQCFKFCKFFGVYFQRQRDHKSLFVYTSIEWYSYNKFTYTTLF